MFRRKKKKVEPVCTAVIVAAGSSQRMGGENKLLVPLGGIPVLAHTLLAFEHCAVIRDIVVVSREQDIVGYGTLAQQTGITKLHTIVRGGESRTASVLAGVQATDPETQLVAVHDGGRPLVSDAVITETVQAALQWGAAAPIVPVKDSIKRISNGCIAADVRRDTLGAVQTPQVFRRDDLRRALTVAAWEGKVFTDDCAAVEAMGITVHATQGSYENIKITTPEDFWIAAALLQHRIEQGDFASAGHVDRTGMTGMTGIVKRGNR